MMNQITVPQTGKLADTLGQLLLDAINDAKSLDPKVFGFDMNNWVVLCLGNSEFEGAPVCLVCLGGASMVCRMNVMTGFDFDPDSDDQMAGPGKLGTLEQRKISAINSLREGLIGIAWEYLDPHGKPRPTITGELNDLSEQAAEVSHDPWRNNWQAHLAHKLIELGI